MDNKEVIILDTSDEAASIQTVTGWQSSTGRFYGADERMARYDGSTHKTCDCGNVIKQHDYCQKCADVRVLAKYTAMPRAKWDGASMLYSDAAERYFSDLSEVFEHASESEINIADLHIIICEPAFASPIDANDHYCDDLPEDGEVPAEIQAAFDMLNKVISECTAPLSWSPGKYALELDSSTSDVPMMQLAPQGIGPGMVYVSARVRAMMDAWMLDRFGIVDGMTMRDGTPTVECKSCGRNFDWEADPADYDMNERAHNMCGGTQWCIP